MNKCEYYLINSNEEFFVEINSQNKVVFDKNIEFAKSLSWDEGQELISYIEFKERTICDLVVK